jgi:RNA polymerase sigma-70 factor (ECF subfamily)
VVILSVHVAESPAESEAARPLDRKALAAAYDQHALGIFRVLRRLGVPEGAAPDALQDVFLVAWRKHADFEGRSTTRTWLCGIALRVARNYRRERDRRVRERADIELPAGNASPEARYEQTEAAGSTAC